MEGIIMNRKNAFVLGGISSLVLMLGAGFAIAQYNGLYDGNFPLCVDTAGQHLNWNGNYPGGGAVCGTSGPAATPPAIGTPNARTLSLATAYQATDTAKSAFVTVTLSSTAALTLIGGQTQTAQIVIGSTNAVAGGTGTAISTVNNSQTGTVVVGIALNAGQTVSYTVPLPTGWFFAVRQTSGTVSIASAYDQSLG